MERGRVRSPGREPRRPPHAAGVRQPGTPPLQQTAAFRSLDVNGDGIIASTEWPWNVAAFNRLDTNRDGRLTLPELLARRWTFRRSRPATKQTAATAPATPAADRRRPGRPRRQAPRLGSRRPAGARDRRRGLRGTAGEPRGVPGRLQRGIPPRLREGFGPRLGGCASARCCVRRASVAGCRRERSAPAKRRARQRVRESEHEAPRSSIIFVVRLARCLIVAVLTCRDRADHSFPRTLRRARPAARRRS